MGSRQGGSIGGGRGQCRKTQERQRGWGSRPAAAKLQETRDSGFPRRAGAVELRLQ